MFERYLAEAWIGAETVAIDEGQLLGLDGHMDLIRPGHTAKVEILQYLKDLEMVKPVELGPV